MDLKQYFDISWQQYVQIAPTAARIKQLLIEQGEEIINDHIALRTYNHPLCDKNAMAKVFLQQGYAIKGEYTFPEKKLKAIHLEHQQQADLPKIFISELVLEQCHPSLALIFNECEEYLPTQLSLQTLAHIKRPWPVHVEEYQDLLPVSEYAAWLYALGLRVNHFTVSVNHLKYFNSLPALNTFLQSHAIVLNQSGGEIKGTPELMLQQSSTMADKIEVSFNDGREIIPTCYMEFAKRYRDTQGKLFQGFLEQSAARIFESTDGAGNS
jgi:hypothetical protein